MEDTATLLASRGIQVLQLQVGTGGSALVHRACVTAEPNSLGLPAGTNLAIKEYRPWILDDPTQLARIQQEAHVGRRLDHGHIVKTYGLLEPSGGSGDQRTFLILEWIDGTHLEEWYKAQSASPAWDTVRPLSIDLVNAVQALHKEGIKHRDIKPENVMIRGGSATPSAVLMDIGVAEVTGDGESTLHTSLNQFIGSVRYASPQFLEGEKFTEADDVYSLGATLVLLFTGKMIFADVLRKPVIPLVVLQSDRPRFGALAPSIPAPMKILLDACLHRDRRRRPTLDQLREALQEPTSSAFLSTELEIQQKEARGFEVLDVIGEEGFFADLAGEEPTIDHVYTVVRRRKNALKIPSLGRTVAPELWICQAMLKHVAHGVGHFRSFRRREVRTSRPNKASQLERYLGPLSLYAPADTTTEWIEEGAEPLSVQKGDVVLKN